MRFLLDAMLGSLARWLRMMGYDAAYSAQLGDSELLESAKSQGRVLLTRDLELYRRAVKRGLEAYFVEGKTQACQLAELADRFGLSLKVAMDTMRCPLCNTMVETAAKEAIADKLESNTLRYYGEFWRCPNCSQVYWKGAHWKQIKKTLELSK